MVLGGSWPERTLLLLEQSVDPPSDLAGIFPLQFTNSIEEIRADITQWVRRLTTPESSGHSFELLHSSTANGERNAEYQLIHAAAEHSLIITGIGMINVRQDLPPLFGQLRTKRGLHLTFLVPSASLLSSALAAATRIPFYRPTLAADLNLFLRDLQSLAKIHPEVLDRIRLIRYNFVMSFVATVADMGQWGSLMLFELLLPFGEYGLVKRPRLLLRRRRVDGLYDRFASAIDASIQEGRAGVATGSQLQALLDG
jgi:hypothetical protein